VGDENLLSVGSLSRLSEQINLAMSEISAVTKENSVAAEEIFAGAEEARAQMEETVRYVNLLSRMAEQLEGQVSRFHIHADAAPHPKAAGAEFIFSPLQLPPHRKAPSLARPVAIS
jgi:hypothetical protein